MSCPRPPLRLLGVLAVLVLAVLALAAGPPPRAVAREAPPEGLTALEAGPFRRAECVLSGTVEQVTDLRAPGGALGRQVVRLRVARTFKGDPRPGDSVTVLVHGQRPTLNPERPSVPYFQAGSRDRVVLFLGREEGGVAYRLQTLYDAGGKIGAEKEAAVAAVAEIAAVTDDAQRGQKTLAWLLGGLAASGSWTKVYSARELAYLAARRPQLFDKRVRARLRRLPAATLSGDQRFWLRRMFAELEKRGEPDPDPVDPTDATPDAFRERFLAATDAQARQAVLTPLLTSTQAPFDQRAWWAYRRLEPSLRAWFARAAGDRGHRGALPGLLVSYGGEEDPSVREAIVRSVGLLGGPQEVAWLAGRLASVGLRRSALLALARVRTPEALTYLQSALRAAQNDGDRDLAPWIEHLLGPAFVQSEIRAGRAVGPR